MGFDFPLFAFGLLTTFLGGIGVAELRATQTPPSLAEHEATASSPPASKI